MYIKLLVTAAMRGDFETPGWLVELVVSNHGAGSCMSPAAPLISEANCNVLIKPLF